MEGNSNATTPFWPNRRHYWALAGLFAAVAAWGSLVPLQFKPLDFAAAVEQFQAVLRQSLLPRSRTDWVANVLLFVPLAYCLLGAMVVGSRKLWRTIAAVPLVLLLCAVWSLAIEFAQLWFPGRTPSITDIIAQSIGTMIGVVLWLAMGQAVSDWLPTCGAAKRRQDPAVWALGAYCFAIFVCSVLPLDLTISPVELARKYREGRIGLVPFADLHLAVGPMATLVRDMVLFIPVGALAAIWPLKPPRRVRGLFGSLALGGLAVLIVELAQLFVVSRRAATGDWIAGMVGVLVGVLLMRRWRAGGEEASPSAPAEAHDRSAWLWLALAGAYVLLLVVAFCTPLEITHDRDEIKARLAAFEWVPLASLYRGSPINAVAQLVRSDCCALLGALLAMAMTPLRVPRPIRRALLGLALLVAAGVVAAIELFQVLLPPHVPGMTDVVLCTAGVGLGMFVTVRFVDAQRAQ